MRLGLGDSSDGMLDYYTPMIEPTVSGGTSPFIGSDGMATYYGGAGSSGGGSIFRPSPTTPSFWTTLTSALTGAGSILSSRYAVPQLNPGQFISTNAQGQTMYQLAPGQTSAFGLPSSLGGSLGSMLPILLIGGVVLFMFAKK